jgi:hypothetical protein
VGFRYYIYSIKYSKCCPIPQILHISRRKFPCGAIAFPLAIGHFGPRFHHVGYRFVLTRPFSVTGHRKSSVRRSRRGMIDQFRCGIGYIAYGTASHRLTCTKLSTPSVTWTSCSSLLPAVNIGRHHSVISDQYQILVNLVLLSN